MADQHVTTANILTGILQQVHAPSPQTHIEKHGSRTWRVMATAINQHNEYFAQCFLAVADFLEILEQKADSWHKSPIRGFAPTPINFSSMHLDVLSDLNLHFVGQLFQTNDRGVLDPREMSAAVTTATNYSLLLHYKIHTLANSLKTNHSEDFSLPQNPPSSS